MGAWATEDDVMGVPTFNRKVTLAAARGEFMTDGALALVRVMKASRPRWEHRDPKLAAALDEGDCRYLDDPARQPGTEDYLVDWWPPGTPRGTGTHAEMLRWADAMVADPRYCWVVLHYAVDQLDRRGRPDARDWNLLGLLSLYVLRAGVSDRPRDVPPAWRETEEVLPRSKRGRKRKVNVSAGAIVGGVRVVEVKRRNCAELHGFDLIDRGRNADTGEAVGGRATAFCDRSWECPSHCAYVAARLAERLPCVLGPRAWWARGVGEEAAAPVELAVRKTTKGQPVVRTYVTPLGVVEVTTKNGQIDHASRVASSTRGMPELTAVGADVTTTPGALVAKRRDGLHDVIVNVNPASLDLPAHLAPIFRPCHPQVPYSRIVHAVAAGEVVGLRWPQWNAYYVTMKKHLAVYTGLDPDKINEAHDHVGVTLIGRTDDTYRWHTSELPVGQFTLPSGMTPEEVARELRDQLRPPRTEGS